MKTPNQIMVLVHEYGTQERVAGRGNLDGASVRSGQIRDEILAALDETAAERRQLAKHCVVVISKPVHYGDWQPEVWCTFCQVRMEISRNEEKQKLIHRDDCLVGKIEAES